MARIKAFVLYSVDFSFRKPFKHAAAQRKTSDSLLLKCVTESGSIGFGECLPRKYVTGETSEHSFQLLRDRILPKLIGRKFQTPHDVISFLGTCSGKAPQDWLSPATPQTAAWAAVDLALLDAFGHEFNQPIRLNQTTQVDQAIRYSAVFSAEHGIRAVMSLFKIRLYGFRQVKIKIDTETAEKKTRLARRILGSRCDIRVDANMTWNVSQAADAMRLLSRYGIRLFEQPLQPHDIAGLAALIKETGLGVMVDESLNDSESLETLIAGRACTAVNVRISKCGGLVAAYNRCMRALEAGLTVQVGSQVGETSLLSAAQLILISAVRQVTYAEGCFGLHLLQEDPVHPLLQFGYGGRPPPLPQGPGLGVRVNEDVLKRWIRRKESVG